MRRNNANFIQRFISSSLIGLDYLFGGVALGLVGSYFTGVFIYLFANLPEWRDFFVDYLIELTLLPALALGAVILYRLRLADLLFGLGAEDEAYEYAKARTDHYYGRSLAEALVNRTIIARHYYNEKNFSKGENLLEESLSFDSLTGTMLSGRIGWWLAEGYLIEDKLQRCQLLLEDCIEADPWINRAQLWACRAELSVRRGNNASWDSHLNRAMWEDHTHWRVKLSQLYGRVWWGRTDLDWTKAREVLKGCRCDVRKFLSFREFELKRVEALIALHRGEEDKALTLYDQVSEFDRATGLTKKFDKDLAVLKNRKAST